LVERVRPFIRKFQMERFHPKRLAADAYGSGTELARLLRDIPGELRALLHQARSGKLKVEFHHRGLAPMTSSQDRVSNRVAFSIVLAALIIGSSLIVLSGVPPTWGEIPVIGLAGFVVAGLMGFWLLYTIIRGGRM
jgi:ubiquinone biosynthesis protein